MSTKINTAITLALKSITGVPTLAEENGSFKPELLTPWMRMTILPAEPSQVTIGYNRQLRFAGLAQIDYFVPSNTKANVTLADTIVDWFNHKDNRFLNNDGQDVTILAAWRGVGVTDTDWYRVPLYVRYEAFSQ